MTEILNCDICGAPMVYSKGDYPLEGITNTFKCTKCNQIWNFSKEGIRRVILARMYPQKMNTAMRHEFIDFKVSEYLFEQKALLIAGEIDAAEFDKRKVDIAIEAKEAHLKVPEKRSWKFWKKRT